MRIGEAGGELSPDPHRMKAAFLIQAVASWALATTFVRASGSGTKLAMPGYLLGVYGLATLVTALFQADSEQTFLWVLTANQIHQDSAHFGVAVVLAAIATTGYRLRGEDRWQAVVRVSYLAIALALVIGMTFPLDAWPSIHGMLERGLLGITLLWAEFVAVILWLRQDPSQVHVR